MIQYPITAILSLSMFIATLFITARNWDHLRHPPTDERIMKIWYIYTKENYSAIRKNRITKFHR